MSRQPVLDQFELFKSQYSASPPFLVFRAYGVKLEHLQVVKAQLKVAFYGNESEAVGSWSLHLGEDPAYLVLRQNRSVVVLIGGYRGE